MVEVSLSEDVPLNTCRSAGINAIGSDPFGGNAIGSDPFGGVGSGGVSGIML